MPLASIDCRTITTLGLINDVFVSVLFMPRFRITFEADTVMVLLFICLFFVCLFAYGQLDLHEDLMSHWERKKICTKLIFFLSFFSFFFGSFILVTLRSVKGKVCKKFS